MQPLFLRGPSATTRLVVTVLLSIVLMNVDHRQHSLEKFRALLSGLLYPIHYAVDLPIRLYYWADDVISNKKTLLEKNHTFEIRYLKNRILLQKLDIIEKENQRLRRLLKATPKTTERLLTAEIISADIDPYRHLSMLNKGSRDDAYQGQPVIDAHGIMGQLIHVGLFSSTLMRITDISHAIPVEINRTNLRTIAYGSGIINKLALRHLPHNLDVKVGDLLVSSGLGGTFSPSYPVATISKVEHLSSEAFATVEATPLAQLDKSREVLLLWNKTIETEEDNLNTTVTEPLETENKHLEEQPSPNEQTKPPKIENPSAVKRHE